MVRASTRAVFASRSAARPAIDTEIVKSRNRTRIVRWTFVNQNLQGRYAKVAAATIDSMCISTAMCGVRC